VRQVEEKVPAPERLPQNNRSAGENKKKRKRH